MPLTHSRDRAAESRSLPEPSKAFPPLLLTTALLLGAAPALAAPIVRDIDFEAVNQNPFDSGPHYSEVYVQTVSLPTQRADFPAATFPVVPPAFLQLGATVAGELDLDFYAGIDSGRLNINYPVRATFDVPDGLAAGETFALGSSATVLPDGYSFLLPVPTSRFGGAPSPYIDLAQFTSGAPSLMTSNPGIGAGVDLTITNHNSIHLEACADVLIGTPCADIVSADLPSLGSTTVTLLSATSGGDLEVLPGVPGATISENLPVTVPLGGVPPFASFTVAAPDLSQVGSLGGSALVASTTSNIATLDLDIDQLISNVALNPLGLPPLTGSIGPVDYSLLDAHASMSGGLYQDLIFTGSTGITLGFDHPIRASVNGVDTGAVNILSFMAGDDVRISPGFRTSLHVAPIFSFANNLHNSTGIALSAELDAQALSASITGVGSIGPLVPHTELGIGPAKLELYSNDFSVDVQSVAALPFDVGFEFGDLSSEMSISPTLLGLDGDNGLARFDVLRNGSLLTSFNASGRVQYGLPCIRCDFVLPEFFLPDDDLEVDIDGEIVNFGNIFCLSDACDDPLDLSGFDALVHAALVDGFDPVYFADSLPAFQLGDPLLSDMRLDPLLRDVFVSHTQAAPDAGFVRTLDMDLYRRVTTVPEPGTNALLASGLLGIGLVTWRRRTRSSRRNSPA